MPIVLRPYQSQIIDGIRAHLSAGKRSVLVVSATGSGKTSLTAHMIAGAVAKGKRAWFCVHRQELVRQSVHTLQSSAELNVGVIAPKYPVNSYWPAQVASIQTLMRRWERYPLPDLLVLDECHHVCSRSWSKLLIALLERKPGMKIIGLTATPTRLDGRGMGEWFETIVDGPPVAQLISEKYLSPYRIFAPSTADLGNVHTVAGDYNRAELDEAMRGSRVVGDAINEYRQKCAGKRALMFLWSVRASEQMAETLNAAGIPAVHIDGKTPDDVRTRAVVDFRAGRVKVLTNVEIVTEGFDLPAIEACFLLRPTQSLGLYLQMVGRALRLYPGKESALIMDHSGLAFQHGLPDDPREWSLDGIKKKAKGPQESPVRQCMKCYAVMPVQASKCRECGFVFVVKGREVEVEAGELQEVDPAKIRVERKREQGSAQDYDSLVAVGRRRGYKSPERWAQYVIDGRNKKFTVQESQQRNADFSEVC